MSKFDLFSGNTISSQEPKLLTLGGLLGATIRAPSNTSIRLLYNGQQRSATMQYGLRRVGDIQTLGLEAKLTGFMLSIGMLRDRSFLPIELRQSGAVLDGFDDIEISVKWHGDGILLVSGIDLNEHHFDGIYLNLVKK